ncbi:MAG: hypothetical protein ACK5KU_10090 [Beutenbergiaceae bacterium]
MDFIFMLTHNDRTVDNAIEVLEATKSTGLKHIGFKDVGATPEQQRSLCDAAHAAGMVVYLEVVSTSVEAELESVKAGRAAGVDWILGGTNPEAALPLLAGSGVKYAPFPGRIEGHPSTLNGSVAEIAADTARLTAMDGVDGVDLLAYRHTSEDPIEVTKAVVAASSGPVIAAGSVVRADQVSALAGAGAIAYTIGGAIFDGQVPGDDIASRVATALEWARSA